MFLRCPRCALSFDAPGASAVCPRCSAIATSPAVPATRASYVLPDSQAATHRTELAPPPVGAWAQPRVLEHLFTPPSTEDRGAIAGRAVTAAVLSALAVVGGCNPIGWIAMFAAIRAYGDTAQPDLGPASERTGRALTLSWIAFASTSVVWLGGIALWWFNPE